MTDVLFVALLALLICGVVGTAPLWPYAANYGYGPSGVLFLLFVGVLVMALSRRP